MDAVRLVACLLLALPAGWIAGVAADRVPERKPLLRPFPKPTLAGSHLTIHAVTLALFALAAVRFSDAPWLTIVAFLVFFTVVVALSAIDLDTQRLPDRLVGTGLLVSIPLVTLASVTVRAPEQIRYALAGALFYFGFLFLAHLVMPRGMGFGDVKMSALLGLFVGWLGSNGTEAVSLVLYAMIVGFIGGSLVGIVLFSFRRKSKHYPFGPFLVAGAIAVIAFTPQLLPS